MNTRCGAYLRPDVVWFGDAPSVTAVSAASGAARRCNVFLSIRTLNLVYSAAAVPFEALKTDVAVVEINPEPTLLASSADHVLSGPAGEVLPALKRALRVKAWSYSVRGRYLVIQRGAWSGSR